MTTRDRLKAPQGAARATVGYGARAEGHAPTRHAPVAAGAPSGAGGAAQASPPSDKPPRYVPTGMRANGTIIYRDLGEYIRAAKARTWTRLQRRETRL